MATRDRFAVYGFIALSFSLAVAPPLSAVSLSMVLSTLFPHVTYHAGRSAANNSEEPSGYVRQVAIEWPAKGCARIQRRRELATYTSSSRIARSNERAIQSYSHTRRVHATYNIRDETPCGTFSRRGSPLSWARNRMIIPARERNRYSDDSRHIRYETYTDTLSQVC